MPVDSAGPLAESVCHLTTVLGVSAARGHAPTGRDPARDFGPLLQPLKQPAKRLPGWTGQCQQQGCCQAYDTDANLWPHVVAVAGMLLGAQPACAQPATRRTGGGGVGPGLTSSSWQLVVRHGRCQRTPGACLATAVAPIGRWHPHSAWASPRTGRTGRAASGSSPRHQQRAGLLACEAGHVQTDPLRDTHTRPSAPASQSWRYTGMPCRMPG